MQLADMEPGALRAANAGFVMIFGLFGGRKTNEVIFDRQYAALTSAARHPVFFTHFNVPDTVMGRFEMLAVAMILYFRRTAHSARSGQEIAQEIVDAFFQDIDHSLRELGIGDQGVPKRMKKFASMFYGRLESYGAALDAGDVPALSLALSRNIHPQDEVDMTALAEWMLAAQAALAAVSEDEISSGLAVLPAPLADDGRLAVQGDA